MLDAATKRKIDSAPQILVGKVPDPKAQMEQITAALIYKFMDSMDKPNEQVEEQLKEEEKLNKRISENLSKIDYGK